MVPVFPVLVRCGASFPPEKSVERPRKSTGGFDHWALIVSRDSVVFFRRKSDHFFVMREKWGTYSVAIAGSLPPLMLQDWQDETPMTALERLS